MGRFRVPAGERLMLGRVVGPGGCWLWLGCRTPSGYGRISMGAPEQHRTEYTHRLSWSLFRGPIPAGLELDHLCRVRACFNPDHLEPVTHTENLRRSPLTIAGRNNAKTHCPRGHALSGSNLVPSSVGRRCRACADGRYRKRKVAV